MGGIPHWASSDELDHMTELFRPFMPGAVIIPCMRWNPETHQLRQVSRCRFDCTHDSIIYCMIARQEHWFGLKLERFRGVSTIRIFDVNPFTPGEWNAFVRQLSTMFGLENMAIRSEFTIVPRLEGMCGYLALFMMLQDAGCFVAPEYQASMLRIHNLPFAEESINLLNRALPLWHGTPASPDLCHFAMATRILFLEHLIMHGFYDDFTIAGGHGAGTTVSGSVGDANMLLQ